MLIASALRPSDCGTYVAVFAKCFSDELNVPSIPFKSEYLSSMYAILSWKYGTYKTKAKYVSKNDDPTRINGVFFITLADDELYNVE